MTDLKTDIKGIMVAGASGYIGKKFINKYYDKFIFRTVSLRYGLPCDFNCIEAVICLSGISHGNPENGFASEHSILSHKISAFARRAKESGVNHFIFFSTVGLYGSRGYLNGQTSLLDEQSICAPNTAYGRLKFSTEKAILSLEDDKFTVSIIRSPIVYGKDAPGNMAKLKRLVKLCPILPFNYSNNRRSMVCIDNLLYFTKLVIDKRVSGIFIPQDKETYSIKQIVTAISSEIFLFKFPRIIFLLLVKIKPQMMASLYGNLEFDSSVSNKKLGYKAKETNGF